jgi:S1-C subfamily serine protease
MFTFVFLVFLRSVTMTPMELMYHRNVQVTTEENRCSGVILSTGVVLTAFHVLQTDSKIYVNGKEAELVLVRPDIDIVILHAETESLPDIVFGTDVGIATPVVAIGNPNGMVGLVSFGFVVFRDDKDHLFTDTLAMHGFSGGGIYSTTGTLLGIMQGIMGSEDKGSWVVVSLGVETIMKALK